MGNVGFKRAYSSIKQESYVLDVDNRNFCHIESISCPASTAEFLWIMFFLASGIPWGDGVCLPSFGQDLDFGASNSHLPVLSSLRLEKSPPSVMEMRLKLSRRSISSMRLTNFLRSSSMDETGINLKLCKYRYWEKLAYKHTLLAQLACGKIAV